LLLDHLVGARKQRHGRVEVERLGSLEIDDNFEFGGALIAEALARLPSRSCIIDGEAVACGNDGIACFELIRRGTPSIFTLCSAVGSSGATD
jgi:ATP-dependent DNA ligase